MTDAPVERSRWLQKIPLFRNVTNASLLQELADGMEVQAFEPRDVVIRQGDTSDTLYILVLGQVEVTVDGRPIARHGPGDAFGELTMFEPSVRSATVTATERCQCLALSHASLTEAMRKTPRLALNLTRVLRERILRLNAVRVMSCTPEVAAPLDPAATPYDLLRAIPLFAGLSDERFLRRVSSVMKEVAFEPNSPVFRQGDIGDVMYIVLEGTVRVHLEERELCEIAAGAHFGEMALLNAEPRSASVTAATACRMLTLTQQQLNAALGQSVTMAENMLRALGRRVRELTDLVTNQNAVVDVAMPDGATLPYLEVAADSLWVRDEATRMWRMPLSEALAQEYSRLESISDATEATDAPTDKSAKTEEPVDDFRRSLDQEKLAVRELLDAAGPDDAERHAALTEALYGLMRSPIFPKKAYVPVGEALRQGFVDRRPLRVRGVLASPTALYEAPFFLKVADTFREIGLTVDLRFLMVRWENLVETQGTSADERSRVFELRVSEVRKLVQRHDWPETAVEAVDVAVDLDSMSARAPKDFEASIAELENAAEDMSGLDPRLSKDILWITGFYARQESLQRLGEFQPRLDLALRRAIGHRFSAESPMDSAPPVMITSELNKRFLPCYDAALPIININVSAAN